MPDGDGKRKRYYCSREWAQRKTAVRERSKGTCERCHRDRASHVHHDTYDRLYNEAMTDLRDLCEACHKFIHDKSDFDPVAYFREGPAKPAFKVIEDGWIQCPQCKGDQDYVHIASVRVLQGSAESRVTRDGTTETAGDWKILRGSAVDVQFTCECGHAFTWHMQFRKGCTMFDVRDTPDDLLRDDELWRD